MNVDDFTRRRVSLNPTVLRVMNTFVTSEYCVKDTPLTILLLCLRNVSIRLKLFALNTRVLTGKLLI